MVVPEIILYIFTDCIKYTYTGNAMHVVSAQQPSTEKYTFGKSLNDPQREAATFGTRTSNGITSDPGICSNDRLGTAESQRIHPCLADSDSDHGTDLVRRVCFFHDRHRTRVGAAEYLCQSVKSEIG
jgi:hypothetical protein